MQAKEKLQEIKQKIESGGAGEKILVRSFLEWFDSKRRGVWVVNSIRNLLRELKLETIPDFESAYIDSYIRIIKEKTTLERSETQTTDKELVGGYDSDPTYRISKLAAANTVPESVTPQQSLSEAITLMMANDFSQLPVMSGERDVKGLISWKTVGSRLALNNMHGNKVSEFMEPVRVVSRDSSIFSVIEEIMQSECVLVKDDKNRVSGIITNADLGAQFGVLSKPFLILGEIENYIRKLLDNKFTKEQLCSAVDPDNSERKIEAVSDLTFGEYLRVIENQERWSTLGFKIDRKIFISKLDEVRKIRNSVMHFDPDGVDKLDMEKLGQFCDFLRTLERCGAIEN